MSIPTSDVLDLSPLTGLMGDLLDPKLPSDHTCVFVSLTSTPRSTRPTIPRWVSRHPKFGDTLRSLLEEVCLSEAPADRVEEVKEVIYEAVRR
eukprot:6809347-Pyramimonas_sp.AAC.1